MLFKMRSVGFFPPSTCHYSTTPLVTEYTKKKKTHIQEFFFFTKEKLLTIEISFVLIPQSLTSITNTFKFPYTQVKQSCHYQKNNTT